MLETSCDGADKFYQMAFARNFDHCVRTVTIDRSYIRDFYEPEKNGKLLQRYPVTKNSKLWYASYVFSKEHAHFSWFPVGGLSAIFTLVADN